MCLDGVHPASILPSHKFPVSSFQFSLGIDDGQTVRPRAVQKKRNFRLSFHLFSNTTQPSTQQQQPTPAPRTNNGPVPMDIDAAYQAQQCFRCGDEGHISRDCTTSVDVIRQRFGRNSMIPPPRPGQSHFALAQRVRAAEFANAAEFVNAMTQE